MFRSRPKLSYDQTIQTEMTSDQTFQTEVTSDQPLQTKMISDQIFQTKLSFDQTEPRPLSRLYCAYRSDSNSDHCADYKKTMIRPSRPNLHLIRSNPDHGPDYKDYDHTFQTKLTSDQTEPRPWSRL